MKLKLAKCKFGRSEIQFLGHIINHEGIRFIPAFADLMHPIQKLLKKNIKFEWTEDYDKAFRTAKETLMRDSILYHSDPKHPGSSKQMPVKQHLQMYSYNHTPMME